MHSVVIISATPNDDIMRLVIMLRGFKELADSCFAVSIDHIQGKSHIDQFLPVEKTARILILHLQGDGIVKNRHAIRHNRVIASYFPQKYSWVHHFFHGAVIDLLQELLIVHGFLEQGQLLVLQFLRSLQLVCHLEGLIVLLKKVEYFLGKVILGFQGLGEYLCYQLRVPN